MQLPSGEMPQTQLSRRREGHLAAHIKEWMVIEVCVCPHHTSPLTAILSDIVCAKGFSCEVCCYDKYQVTRRHISLKAEWRARGVTPERIYGEAGGGISRTAMIYSLRTAQTRLADMEKEISAWATPESLSGVKSEGRTLEMPLKRFTSCD